MTEIMRIQIDGESGIIARLTSSPLDFRCGITNLVSRSTASAAELTVAELTVGRRRLMAKVTRYAPRYLAVLGIDAYRRAFARPKAILGKQPELVGGTVFVMTEPFRIQVKEDVLAVETIVRLSSDRRMS
jgi:TDG/mug DNA glycosylase family protein